MTIPFQLSLFDGGEVFMPDGVMHFFICDEVNIRDAKDGSVASHFKCLDSLL